MSIWETLGELIGRAFKSIVDAILGVIGWRPDRLTEVDTELVSASLKPEMFKTEEFKKLIPELKEKLKHSPQDIPDWLDTVLSIPSGLLIEPVFEMMTGIETEKLPDKAKVIFKGIALLLDYAVLAGILDNVSTALSGTLLRKVGDFADRIISASGISQMLSYGLGTALAPAIAPPLIYAINQQIEPFRLDPASWITAFRRKYKDFTAIENDLREQGWNKDRITALKFVTLYYPSPAELVHWTAREVFEPDKIAKYGLMADADKLRREDFYKAGMDDEQINNHWIAHWEHASWTQLIEMLHRGIVTEQDVIDWFPLVEVAPYWAKNLIKIAYTWPTRVDVRRFWDMRTISPERLEKLYEGMGYRDENLEDYIKWTKVYTDFPMMIARFKNGWITEGDIYNWLVDVGIPEERAKQFIEEKTKPEKPAQVEEERKATATEIMKGVKKGFISWVEGVEMLGDLGYDVETAEFKLTVYGAVSEGSPESYTEFKQMTQMWRRSIGLPAKVPPIELTEAEKALIEAEAELKRMIGEGTKGEKLLPYRKAKDDAAYRYRQLLIKWKEEQKEG